MTIHTYGTTDLLSAGRADSPILKFLSDKLVDCRVILPDGTEMTFGAGQPRFTATFETEKALAMPPNQFAIGTAYVNGEIDVEGDMDAVMELRSHLSGGLTAPAALALARDLLAPATRVNKRAIDFHYTLGDDFYHTFIDTRWRFYSQGLFESHEDTLEEASEHKLERMWNALGLEPGMRLLDIGGGWGGVGRYCAARGVHVTAVTLAPDSAIYMRRVNAQEGLDVEVVHTDFLAYEPPRAFDHVVIYGVIEHLPNYRRFAAKAWDMLAPGGKMYLDGSATREKFAMTAFTRKYIWPGHHTFMSLPDVTRELLLHGFEIVEVERETADYERTMYHWARRFDAAREQVVARWGEDTYRRFRVYLWAGAHAFKVNRLQAYHVVAQKRTDRGPRPRLLRRLAGQAVALIS
ncbi:class I SAM-dependent methyltransferase [Nocardia mexicana]|uniref:Cyclopropane-fatty-acyl-phospholipid synthase n=1 Tax=Nocardia mexicana TaxID=279262 RepID=A0A370HEB9_9NOCA|nr:class I SAM-dependent methyltransferase [Nocardia mexicana]RDI55581.1 cyclopropane-fatty-acyl-phospholipid synthase [Nocardia mexicana]